MNGTHYVRKCRHGIVIEQCKCPDLMKPVLEGPCPEHCPHRDEPSEPARPPARNWRAYWEERRG